MPYIVTGEPSSWKSVNYTDKKIDYKYPEGLDLTPGTDLHNSIRDRVWLENVLLEMKCRRDLTLGGR
jgi:hypothetical protein